jgi:hypothetical protein
VSVAEINARLNEFFRESGLLDRLAPPAPKYRYFQKGQGHMYCWTTEAGEHDPCGHCEGCGEVVGEWDTEPCPKCGGSGLGKGWYASFVYRAVGKGSRSGKATRWELDDDSLVKHRKRKDAKARALRLYRRDNGKTSRGSV